MLECDPGGSSGRGIHYIFQGHEHPIGIKHLAHGLSMVLSILGANITHLQIDVPLTVRGYVGIPEVRHQPTLGKQVRILDLERPYAARRARLPSFRVLT